MSRIFITGSADGLGFLAGQILFEQRHSVVLHARTEKRAREIKSRFAGCEAVVIGDVSTIAEMRSVADQVNALGKFDSVIHNVALGTNEDHVLTSDGLTQIFAVNVVAPYVLTAMVQRPQRLIYMSSGMHQGGTEEHLNDPQWEKRSWNGNQAYSDTKLFDLMLSMYFARKWPDTFVNAVNPGWVPTRMGGKGAPDDLHEGAATQAWLAVSDEASAKVSGKYFFHKKQRPVKSSASDPKLQDRLIEYLANLSKVRVP